MEDAAEKSTNTSPSVSVVVPVFNSADTLGELYERLSKVLDQCASAWEIVLVDDGSRDRSYDVMYELRSKDERVTTIRLGRNCGQHHALLCGLRHARHSCAITLDDDLQNPPEEIPKLLAGLAQGYDAVIGRIETKEHSAWRNLASGFVQRANCWILGKPRSLYLSSYRAFSRKALAAMVQYRGVHVYIPAILLRAVPATKITNVAVEHHARQTGRSTYTVRKLIRLFSFLLVNHSFFPLRAIVAWGLLLCVASFFFALYLVVRALLDPVPVPGWTSTIVILCFLSGNLFLALGVLGEYMGRLVDEVSRTQESTIFSINDEH